MAAKKLGDTARLYSKFIARLKVLGCVLCPTCYCYMPPTHQCADTSDLRKAA